VNGRPPASPLRPTSTPTAASSVRSSSPLRSGSPLRPPARTEDVPFKHVIETYVHRDQTITCVCGWHGSCAPGDRGASPWTAHLQEFRTKKR
jgi:hypothetical protein